MKNLTTNQVIFWTLLFFIIVFTEMIVFQNGGFFLLVIGAVLLYWSITRSKKIVLWISIALLGISLISMWSLRLFLMLFFMFLLYKFLTKEDSETIAVQFKDELPNNQIVRNKLFGTSSTPIEDYKWRDVHIQRLIGDITIDTTQTILPLGTSFISIRQGFGAVKIIVPYEVPVRVQYATLYGKAKLLNFEQKKLMNETLFFKDGVVADGAKRELVIHVTTYIGDVEVARQ